MNDISPDVSNTLKPFKRDFRYEKWRWTVFAVTYLAYVGFYLTRKSFSVAKVGILDDPNIAMDKIMMGKIDFAYLIAYAVGQFVWGMFGDRFGARKVVLIGMLGSVIAGFAMGVSSIVLFIGLFFFIQGLCQSTGWAPLAKNVSSWFSRKERGRVYGFWCSNYAIGGLIASPFAGLMGSYFGNWRYALYMPAATLFIIWLLFLFFQRNRPEDVGLPPVEEYRGEDFKVVDFNESKEKPKEAEEGSWEAIKTVLKNPVVLLLGGVYFFLKPTRYAILFWGPVIISEKLGTDMKESGFISALFELGGPLGVLFVGYVSDKFFQARRMPICVIFLFLLSAVLFSFNILTSTDSVLMMGILLFAIGFFLFGPDSLIVGTAAVDFGTKKGASTAVGLVNCFGSIGGALGGSLPGYISEKYGWDILFYFLAGAVLLGALLLLPKWNAVPPSRKTYK